MEKINWDSYLVTKLKVAGFIFALLGWFLLFDFLFGSFFEQELMDLEKTIESRSFIWGLRIFIISLVIALMKGQNRINEKLKEHRSLRIFLRLVYFVGALGWLWYFVTLAI